MREIKFRAWTKEEMIYEGWNKDFFVTKEVVFRYDDVMQYTGLKDKNGVDIYEGDKDRNGNVVEFLNGCYCLNGDRPLYATNFEITGNIYENKGE